MTRVVISQPMYFPWAGFLAQMSLADVMIWLDDARFSKGSFTNRIQVLLDGQRKWMSVPLAGKGTDTRICDLRSGQEGWQGAHLSLLRNAIGRRPFGREALDLAQTAFGAGDVCATLVASAEGLAKAIGLPARQTLLSSATGIGGTGWPRVLDLVRSVGGTEYITGHGARQYLDHAAFESAGIAVQYMDYAPVPWPQGNAPFTPYVTGLDLVSSVAAEDRLAHLNPRTVDWRRFLDGVRD